MAEGPYFLTPTKGHNAKQADRRCSRVELLCPDVLDLKTAAEMFTVTERAAAFDHVVELLSSIDEGEHSSLTPQKIKGNHISKHIYAKIPAGQPEESAVNDKLMEVLTSIFPDSCRDFLRKHCVNKSNDPETIESILHTLFQTDIPRRKTENPTNDSLDTDEQYKLMVEVLPDADPIFLRKNYIRLANNPDKLKNFIAKLIETRKYPTLKDSNRKQHLLVQLKQYTSEFRVEQFLELFPNPVEYFENPTRKTWEGQIPNTFQSNFVINRFKNLFPEHRLVDILNVLQAKDFGVFVSYKTIAEQRPMLKRPRKTVKTAESEQIEYLDIPLLQELAYVTNIKEIKQYLKIKEEEKTTQFALAKANNLLLECGCCFDTEIMAEDAATCPEGHIFCHSCIIKSVEIKLAENKTTISCLSDCSAQFQLRTLQRVLNPKLFYKLALRRQLEEVKAAGINELESCPFCDFATIPVANDKVFKCLNDECMRESCRLCHEPSHIPLRCNEVEKSADVKARTYIEDKMTEALLRKCWKCDMKFIKEDGCNKMTCSCGASMCYVCGKPVTNYSHFNGQGGTELHLCPLYSDTTKLHLENVRRVGEQAKEEIRKENPGAKLHYDPLTGFPQPAKEDKVYKPGKQYDVREHMGELARFFNGMDDFIVGNNHDRHHVHHGHHNHHHHRHSITPHLENRHRNHRRSQ